MKDLGKYPKSWAQNGTLWWSKPSYTACHINLWVMWECIRLNGRWLNEEWDITWMEFNTVKYRTSWNRIKVFAMGKCGKVQYLKKIKVKKHEIAVENNYSILNRWASYLVPYWKLRGRLNQTAAIWSIQRGTWTAQIRLMRISSQGKCYSAPGNLVYILVTCD